MQTRREVLRGTLAGLAALGAGPVLPLFRTGDSSAAELPEYAGASELPAGAREGGVLDVLPGKRPLIRRTARPPNYETPLSYFQEVFTPNDAFFVRYHLPAVPDPDPASWKLTVAGEALERPLELSLPELKRGFEAVEVPAVCYCAGNRRGLFRPHVPGVQWAYGAMGNARWKGARLKDVLARGGVRKEAVEVAADGADAAPGKVPDFVKSIPLWKALDENTLLAYEMNGEPIPRWNGSPVRLVVPGWISSYWVKHLVRLEVSAKPFQGFWMNPAYRIPKGAFATVDRFVTQETDTTTPIADMVVNSVIVHPTEGQKLEAESSVTVRGVAWDGGRGISRVELSQDGGTTWRPAELGRDYGPFSFRPWSGEVTLPRAGSCTLAARAVNRIGQTQVTELIHNPSGYHHNLIHRVRVVLS
ncbi:MAG: molybdopterin-dependent oxidoreductase [Deltaproteobacteria bacterium]|nr:molybdopterin-dependent oxidoreductase [Deltaproteobacteria bacterium]